MGITFQKAEHVGTVRDGNSKAVITQVMEYLSGHRIAYSTEDVMQSQVYSLLLPIVECQREVRLSARDRIDLLTACGIGIECKVKGSPAAIVGQLLRYAESDQVKMLVLVTSKRTHLATELFREKEILGKPLYGVWTGMQF